MLSVGNNRAHVEDGKIALNFFTEYVTLCDTL